MTRQLEQAAEDRSKRRNSAIVAACHRGLQDSVGHAGGVLTGLSVKYGAADVLIVLKAVMPAGPMVAFIGADTLGDGLAKASREARTDSLRWRPDKWAKD